MSKETLNEEIPEEDKFTFEELQDLPMEDLIKLFMKKVDRINKKNKGTAKL